MNTLLLPDFFAMAFLLIVLTFVQRKYQREAMRPWMAGLLLILLECAAHILYGTPLPLRWHRLMHVIALDSYLLAGILFLRSSSTTFRRMPRGVAYLVINALPHLVLLTIYGLEIRTGWLYRAIVVAGCVAGFVSARILRRGWPDYVALACLWTPLILAASNGSYRVAIYISLAGLYTLDAIVAHNSLPKGSLGKPIITTGLLVWALIFVTHPWIAVSHREWTDLAAAIWNMQKFLITIGFMLVLFERQLGDNEWLALHDELTGLANRRLFEDRLSASLDRAEREGTLLLLFNLDLDGFKTVNDTLGHDVGDILLKRVSANMQAAVRKTDTLARLGGDEFALLATDVRPAGQQSRRKWPGPTHERPEASRCDLLLADADTLLRNYYPPDLHPILGHAERICGILKNAASQPVEVQTHDGPKTLRVTVSVGLAIYPADGTDPAVLAHLADRRMYEDKRAASRTSGATATQAAEADRASSVSLTAFTSLEQP